MRKSKKQLMKSGIAGLLIASMAVGGGTLAYLTDAETTDNTFTVGKVKIALTEPNYPGNESAQVQNLVPNEIVKKDPQVKNVGINDAIIYLKVEVPKADVTIVEDGGARSDKKVQEIFTLKNLKTGDDGTWMEIRKDDSATDKCVYVFAYKTKLAKDATTTPLFDEVQLKNVLEKEIDATTQNIKINAYAIQADNILDVDTTTLDQATLDKVYSIYVNQSGTILLDGKTLNVHMKTLAGDQIQSSDPENTYDSHIKAIQHSNTEPSEEVKTDANSLVSTKDSEKPVYMWFEDGAIKWWSEAETIQAGRDLSYLCYEMCNLADISGLSAWDVGNVTNMEEMFAGFHFRNMYIVDLSPLSNWDTGNVTSMDSMFANCSSLAVLSALANWDTGNVTNMHGMFYKCSSLTDLSPLSNWCTGNVTDMGYMFSNCSELTDLHPLAVWDTNNVTDMCWMFNECENLTDSSAIDDWNITNVRIGSDSNSGFYRMFYASPSHPEFTKRAGTWDSNGTFTPTT